MLIFNLAGDVEIVSPPELREAVIAQVRLLLNNKTPVDSFSV